MTMEAGQVYGKRENQDKKATRKESKSLDDVRPGGGVDSGWWFGGRAQWTQSRLRQGVEQWLEQ